MRAMYKLRDESEEVAVSEVTTSIENVLSNVGLCSMARLDAHGPWIATMYFATLNSHSVVVLSDPSSRHFESIDGEVALTIFDSHQRMEEPKQGLQIVGVVKQLTEVDEIGSAIGRYCQRFPSARTWLSDVDALSQIDSRPFAIEFKTVKVFDEIGFGLERWITLDWV
jgi:uncharacterized protein YhbP (UPF0306 family)